jgi:prolyl 3-hydroxylase /prolyl 3,4-dihydroxylase
MAKTHPRSPSPEPKTAGLKRPKIGHPSPTTSPTGTPTTGDGASGPGPAATTEDVIACFAPDLLDADNVDRLAASYASGEPFKHALVEKLFRDDFLQKVKDECLSELHFTEKETDIYKVRSILTPLAEWRRPFFFFNFFFNFFLFYRSIRQAI